MAADPRLSAVNEALARAHHASLHGSRDARSGLLDEQAEVVRAVLSLSQEAMRAWENWEAINEALTPNSELTTALAALDLHALGSIRKALARDAILGAFRLTDASSGDRLSLCRIASWLADPGLQARLVSRQWALDQGYPPPLAGAAAQSNERRIQRLLGMISPDWGCVPPVEPELVRLREKVRPTRNHLAHALEGEPAHLPDVDAVRRLIELTLDLSTDAALVWIGAAVQSEDYRAHARESARSFWRYAFEGTVAAWSREQVQAAPVTRP